MPVRIVPEAKAPLMHVTSAVDASLRAGFKIGGMTLDPGRPKPAEKAPKAK
jgi:hypothetical protein